MTRWAELVAATTLLTRLPVGGLVTNHPPAANCVWAYPLVGILVGGLGAAVLTALVAAGMPQSLAAVWAVAATIILTGALHEDGLADTADGFGGGKTIERRLAIMRDSRIGSYGAVALVFSLMLRVVALAITSHPVMAMISAAMLGRGAMLLPLMMLRPARPDGLSASLAQGPRMPPMIGLALTTSTLLWVPTAAILTSIVSGTLTILSRRKVGGYTGDVLGAVEQAVECIVLSVLTS